MSFGFGFALPHWQTLSGGFSPAGLFAGGTVQGAWYDPSDSTTIFEDTAGTIPCRTPGATVDAISVGLMLDKSQGLALGSELVTNGGPGFTATTGWTTSNATVSASGGKLVCTVTGASPSVYWSLTTNIGTWYKVNIVWENVNATGPSILVNSTGGLSITTTNTDATIYFCAVATTTFVQMQLGNTGGTSTRIISLSTKTISGNHAIAWNNSTARPVLSARVNLLTYSENFSNPIWLVGTVGAGNPTKGTTTTTKPDGTSGTVDTLTYPAVSGGQVSYAYQVTDAAYVNVSMVASVWMRVASGTGTVYINLEDGTTGPSGGNFVAGTALSLTTTWQRFSLTGTRTTSSGNLAMMIGFDTRAAAGQTNAGSLTVQIWGADLRPANIGTSVPAYQRIADQYTYDSSGFPRYLVFNGTASGMYTPANLNLSGTDKATVFAGARKNTDVTIITEFSASAGANNGTFLLATGGWAAENGTYVRSSRGTAAAFAQPAANSYPSPRTDVLTGTSDIAGDSVVLRINGTQAASSTSDQGTGNYGTYPLYIGSRNNASLWFNGYLYSLIVVGAASTAAQISSTESWINVKEGGVY